MRISPRLLLLPFLLNCSSKLSPEGTEPGSCSDLADNDEDSLFDCDDPGCAADPDCADGGDEGDGTGAGGDTDADEGAGTGGGDGDTDTDGGEGGGSGGGSGGGTGDSWTLAGTVSIEFTNLDTSQTDTCTGAASGTLLQADPFFVLATDCDGFSGFAADLDLGDGALEGEVDPDDNSITGVVLWLFMSETEWTGTWDGPTLSGGWTGTHTDGPIPVSFAGSLTLEATNWEAGGDTAEPGDEGDGG